MADPDRRRLPHSRPGLTGSLDFLAKARFCAFSWSENRTKLELNQNCMDSMTSATVLKLQRMRAGLYIACFFGWVGAHPKYESCQLHKIEYC